MAEGSLGAWVLSDQGGCAPSSADKPVTNSRDTQEVLMDQGLQMLKIFSNYNHKSSILDDFQFYDEREAAKHQEEGSGNSKK